LGARGRRWGAAESSPFEEVLKEGDKDGDGKLSAEEVPERLRHKGSWNAIDLDDGFLEGRIELYRRAIRSECHHGHSAGRG
jgi:hypothetical protein